MQQYLHCRQADGHALHHVGWEMPRIHVRGARHHVVALALHQRLLQQQLAARLLALGHPLLHNMTQAVSSLLAQTGTCRRQHLQELVELAQLAVLPAQLCHDADRVRDDVGLVRLGGLAGLQDLGQVGEAAARARVSSASRMQTALTITGSQDPPVVQPLAPLTLPAGLVPGSRS